MGCQGGRVRWSENQIPTPSRFTLCHHTLIPGLSSRDAWDNVHHYILGELRLWVHEASVGSVSGIEGLSSGWRDSVMVKVLALNALGKFQSLWNYVIKWKKKIYFHLKGQFIEQKDTQSQRSSICRLLPKGPQWPELRLIKARSFFQICYVGSGAQGLELSLATFTGYRQGAGLEGEQTGYELDGCQVW